MSCPYNVPWVDNFLIIFGAYKIMKLRAEIWVGDPFCTEQRHSLNSGQFKFLAWHTCESAADVPAAEDYVPCSSPRTFPRQLRTSPEAADHQQGQQREAQDAGHYGDHDGLRGNCHRKQHHYIHSQINYIRTLQTTKNQGQEIIVIIRPVSILRRKVREARTQLDPLDRASLH
jgi:hypothetical protein